MKYYRTILNVQAVAPALDPDAEAFLTAAGITDATITSAIDDLVVSLKADSLWSKMVAIYPLVGGTAATHKFNLKDPRDLDVAFRLTFVGSPTHDANGVQGNGSSQYARTYLNPSIDLVKTNSGCSFYVRTDGTTTPSQGVLNGADPNNRFYFADRGGGNVSNGILGSEPNRVIFSNLDAKGFYSFSRDADSQEGYKNGVLQNTNTTPDASTLPNAEFTIMALSATTGSIITYYPRQLAFFALHNSLTSADATNFNTAITTFQTALSRNV